MKAISILKSEKGSVVLPIVIMSGLSLFYIVKGVMDLNSSLETLNRGQSQSYQIHLVVEQVKAILSDSAACKSTMVGMNPVTGSPVLSIKTPFSAAGVFNASQALDQKESVLLKSMRISNYVPSPAAGRGSANLYLEFTKVEALGPDVVRRHIPVSVTLTIPANQISDCAAANVSTMNVCQMLGGALEGGKCKDLNIQNGITTWGNLITANRTTVNGAAASLQSATVVGSANIAGGLTVNGNLQTGTFTGAAINVASESIIQSNLNLVSRICGPGACQTFSATYCNSSYYMYGLSANGVAQCRPF